MTINASENQNPSKLSVEHGADNPSSTDERIICIDRFRGFIVFSMVFFQLLARFDNLGFLTRIASHNVNHGILIMPGMTLADIVAPMFFLAIALNYKSSFERRAIRDGKAKTYMHFIVRYLFFIGFGCFICTAEKIFNGDMNAIVCVCFILCLMAIISGIGSFIVSLTKAPDNVKRIMKIVFSTVLCLLGLVNIVYSTYDLYYIFWTDESYSYWGVLQSIGGAGLLSLLFIEKGTLGRLISSVFCFSVFTFIHQLPGNMERIDADVQGGIIGILGWGSMLIAFTVAADLYYMDKRKLKYYILSIPVTAAFAVTAYFTLIINKGSVSPGYILMNIPISLVFFLIFALTDKIKMKFMPITWWGRNPILMFFLQYTLVEVVTSVIPGMDKCPAPLALLFCAVIISVMTFIVYKLYRADKVIKL